jgi:Domain of unknown function (DUF4397)
MKRFAIGMAAFMAAVVSCTVSASAQDAPTAHVRVAHFSPDTPGVDVYVDGQQAVGNMGFETVTDYLPVPAGEHLFELRPTGAAPTSAPVWSGRPTLESGTYYTAAGIGPRSELTAQLFTDSMSAPPPGQANVRFIHAAVGADAVNVAFGGSPLVFNGAAFATPTEYEPVVPGRYDVSLTDGSGVELVGSQFVEFAPGFNYTVVAIGGDATPLRLLPVVDARAAATPPAGALATGAGGTAERPDSTNARVPVFVVAGVLVAIAVMATALRRSRLRLT